MFLRRHMNRSESSRSSGSSSGACSTHSSGMGPASASDKSVTATHSQLLVRHVIITGLNPNLQHTNLMSSMTKFGLVESLAMVHVMQGLTAALVSFKNLEGAARVIQVLNNAKVGGSKGLKG